MPGALAFRSQRAMLSTASRLGRRKNHSMTLVKMTIAWSLFIGMFYFYAMLPIASLQLLPFLFFGCISLLVGLWDEAGGYRR